MFRMTSQILTGVGPASQGQSLAWFFLWVAFDLHWPEVSSRFILQDNQCGKKKKKKNRQCVVKMWILAKTSSGYKPWI